MKLLVQGIRDHHGVRVITGALLKVDIGARVNFKLDAGLVRIEGRLTLDDARTAIEREGFRVASVIDGTVVDSVFRPAREPRAPALPARRQAAFAATASSTSPP